MADYQQIVDRVRAFVAGADQTRSDAMAETATAYSALCDEANTRLRRCVDYLHRGLRSEAIHLADCHPSLLDMVAALDIPESEHWEQLCATYELARPARMMIELAQELNEAYAHQQPLEHLLKKHRLLALSRAPIGERLQVIRELAAADPENTCWGEDQESFELARARQLRTEVAAAVRSRSVHEIDRLANEVLQQPWRIELPSDLKEAVDRTFRSLHAERALLTLTEMVPQMQAAISEASYPRAKQLVEKWRNIVAESELQVPPGLKGEYQSLRAWVQEQDQKRGKRDSFDTAIAELKVALDTRAPEELLRIHYRTVQDTGIALPADLEREYRAGISKFERSRRFERVVLFAVIGGVIVVVIGFVVMLAWNHLHGNR